MVKEWTALKAIYATNPILMLWFKVGINICFKVVYAFNNAKTNEISRIGSGAEFALNLHGSAHEKSTRCM